MRKPETYKTESLTVRLPHHVYQAAAGMSEFLGVSVSEFVRLSIVSFSREAAMKFEPIDGVPTSRGKVFVHPVSGEKVDVRLAPVHHTPHVICLAARPGGDGSDNLVLARRGSYQSPWPPVDDAMMLMNSSGFLSWDSAEYLAFCEKYDFDASYGKPIFLEAEDADLLEHFRAVAYSGSHWARSQEQDDFFSAVAGLDVLRQNHDRQIEGLMDAYATEKWTRTASPGMCESMKHLFSRARKRSLRGTTHDVYFDFLPSVAGIGSHSGVRIEWSDAVNGWTLPEGQFHDGSMLLRHEPAMIFGDMRIPPDAEIAERLLEQAGVRLLTRDDALAYIRGPGAMYCGGHARIPECLWRCPDAA